MKIKLATSVLTSMQKKELLQKQSMRLSTTFAGLVFCSVSVVSQATENPITNKPAYSLKIMTYGESANRSDNMSESARKDNRRTDVKINTLVRKGSKTVTTETTEQVEVKVSDALNRSIHLKDGGVIWVSKDPASLTPTLNVTTSPSIEMDGNSFRSPINFTINTNYDYFIDSWELAVYDALDVQKNTPLAMFMGRKLENGRSIKWNGHTKQGKKLKAGDQLQYVLKVRDKKGHLDETNARRLSLVGPDRYIKVEENTSVTGTFENNLARQTIPIRGSRVRIFGRDIADDNQISINNNKISLVENKFVIEKLLPEGQHNFDIAITDNKQETYHKPLAVNLKNKYMFMVGLADVTVGQGKVTGNLESLSDGDKYLDGDIFVDGRLAFYLKGKIKGKYLVTAQMDTEHSTH